LRSGIAKGRERTSGRHGGGWSCVPSLFCWEFMRGGRRIEEKEGKEKKRKNVENFLNLKIFREKIKR
jgi:hypothetical protein